MPQHDIQIKVSTDAQIQALKATLNDTKELKTRMADGGRATDALDAEIAELQRTMAQREFDLYVGELQRLIASEKAAGNATDDLERRLAAIQSSTPHTSVSRLNSELRGLLSHIPGVNTLTSSLNGSTLAVGTAIGLVGGLTGAYRQLIRAGIAYNTALETQSVKFETLLGSADAAETRIRELARFPATTPFELQGVAEASGILETLTRGGREPPAPPGAGHSRRRGAVPGSKPLPGAGHRHWGQGRPGIPTRPLRGPDGPIQADSTLFPAFPLFLW